jgi:hypothetical protein
MTVGCVGIVGGVGCDAVDGGPEPTAAVGITVGIPIVCVLCVRMTILGVGGITGGMTGGMTIIGAGNVGGGDGAGGGGGSPAIRSSSARLRFWYAVVARSARMVVFVSCSCNLSRAVACTRILRRSASRCFSMARMVSVTGTC